MAVAKEIERVWSSVHAVARGAAMFLDDPAAEMLHWTGTEMIMRDAVGVYRLYDQLNPLARDVIARAPYSHVVVVVTSPLQGRCAEAIAGLLSDLQPLECHVFCSLSEAMHEEYVPLGEGGEGGGEQRYSHYGEFQALIRKWINRESGVRVTVRHIGLFVAEVFPGLAITPAHGRLSSLLPSDVPSLQLNLSEGDQLKCLEEIHFPWLPRPLQLRIKSFASSFNSFLEQMDLREDLFSLGPTSRVIANQMAILPEARARRKSASQRCSVLLVDRGLDLSAPCLHSGDHLADKMLGLLPALFQGSSDVAINMAPICEGDPQLLVPGCLAQTDQKACSLLRNMLQTKQKEAMMEVMRCLLEALSKEKLSVRPTGRMGRPSSTQLRGFLAQFRSHGKSIEAHSGLLQLACGTVAALDHPLCSQWEQLASDEQVLLMSLSEQDAPSLLHQLSDLLKRKSVRVVDVLSVAMAMYSLVGEDCYAHHSEEAQIREDLVDLITKRRECDMPFLRELGIDDSCSREQVVERVDGIFEVLNGIGQCREKLEQLAQTYTPQANTPYTPLLEQLLESILDPLRPDLPDITHHSHGLSEMLKSSFSLFMSSARPRPSNHTLLILFIVGGVSLAEVRRMREIIASSKTSLQVLLASTELLTPERTLRNIFCTDRTT